MQDVYRSQGVNKCSTHAAQARGQQTPQKSTHRGQSSPTQKPLSLDKLAASGTKPKKDPLEEHAKAKDFYYCLALSLSISRVHHYIKVTEIPPFVYLL